MASWTHVRNNGRSVSDWSMHLVQARSKAATGLKAPMRALARRRTGERRLRFRFSMSIMRTSCGLGEYGLKLNGESAEPGSTQALAVSSPAGSIGLGGKLTTRAKRVSA